MSLQKALGRGWQDGENEPRVNSETLEIMRQRTDWGELLEVENPQMDDERLLNPVDW